MRNATGNPPDLFVPLALMRQPFVRSFFADITVDRGPMTDAARIGVYRKSVDLRQITLAILTLLGNFRFDRLPATELLQQAEQFRPKLVQMATRG